VSGKVELSFWHKMPTVFGEEILESNRKKKFKNGRSRDVKSRETSFPIRTIKNKSCKFQTGLTGFQGYLKKLQADSG